MKESLNGRNTLVDDDNNHSRDIFNDQRNDKKCRSSRKQSTFQESNEPRYEESNVVFDKIKKCYLVLALSFKLFGNLAY